MALKSYHRVWLSSHPHRSTEWLEDKLSDGFHIHHIDGDHSNDSPDNLVLIEASDHFRIHGRPNLSAALLEHLSARRDVREKAAETAYVMRANGSGWREIEKATKYRSGTLWTLAKAYAKRTNSPWPLGRV